MLPIIKANSRLEVYPYESIKPSALKLLNHGFALSAPKAARPEIQRLLKLFECLLQICGLQLTRRTMCSPQFIDICSLFIGALSSERFLEATPSRRRGFTMWFRNMVVELEGIESNIKSQIPALRFSPRHVSKAVASMIATFEGHDLIEEKVWLWRGWHATSTKGTSTYLPLFPVYKTLGREFTQTLYETLSGHIEGRVAGRIHGIKELADFIGGYPRTLPEELTPSNRPHRLSPALLNDRVFAGLFWRGFLVWHTTTAYQNGHGSRISSIATAWNGQFVPLIRDFLIPSRLFAMPNGGLPRLESRTVRGEHTNVRTTEGGDKVKTKLITDVPLSVTDDEAIALLFRDIQKDFNAVVHWASTEVEQTEERVSRRLELAKVGAVRHIQQVGANTNGHKYVSSADNPAWLANAAATFEHHGYLTAADCALSLLYRAPIADTAKELGLPVGDVLNPYLILLVAEHPKITPSFLRSLTLYDKNGDRTGYIEGDGHAMLIGIKSRKGPHLAQQEIHLSARTANIVRQIIRLTEPLRRYLKQKNDGNWRRLLLSTGRGFGYPLAYFPDQTVLGRAERNAERLASACGIDRQKALQLIKRSRLSAIRASKGVLVYIETESVAAMAEALGHEKYRTQLLSHYLPEPIQAFFRERWIRLFQTGIILEATKGSRFRFRAGAFNSASELDQFLSNHALKTIQPETHSSLASTDHHKEVAFGLDTEVLALLLSLEAAVKAAAKPVCSKALYWSKVTARLVAYIESPDCLRLDIRQYLHLASRQVDMTLVEGILYA